MKCKKYKDCPFRKAYGYCAKQIGEDCPIVWEKEQNNDNDRRRDG